MNKEEKVFSNTVINCLSCIYDDNLLKPYKLVNKILQVLKKKKKKLRETS